MPPPWNRPLTSSRRDRLSKFRAAPPSGAKAARKLSSGGEPGQIAEEWAGKPRRKRRDEFRQMLHFEESRRRFDGRLALEKEFYAALNAEIAGQKCPDKEQNDG